MLGCRERVIQSRYPTESLVHCMSGRRCRCLLCIERLKLGRVKNKLCCKRVAPVRLTDAHRASERLKIHPRRNLSGKLAVPGGIRMNLVGPVAARCNGLRICAIEGAKGVDHMKVRQRLR